jgi:hypothetical protein
VDDRDLGAARGSGEAERLVASASCFSLRAFRAFRIARLMKGCCESSAKNNTISQPGHCLE